MQFGLGGGHAITEGSHVAQLASVLVLLILMGTFRMLFVKRAQDPFGIFLLCFAVFYGFRAVLIATGLDTPIPSYLFATSNMDSVYMRTVFGLCLYLIFFMVAAFLVTRRPASSPGLLFSPNITNINKIVFASFALTGLAVLTHAYLLSRFGSFSGIVYAAKVEKALSGSHYLMLPSQLGALCSTATFLETRHRPGLKTAMRYVILGCAVLDSALVFAWGARGFLVIIVAMLVLVSGPLRRPKQPRRGLVGIARVALAAVLVLSMAVFLRNTRDNLTHPGETHPFSQENVFRQASHGVNGNYFDASMLAFRDWPARHQLRDGQDYWNGVLDMVPRKIWPDKPRPFAVEFRQVYEPSTVNGWPVGAPTTWYLNFGWLGLVLGGLVSGAVIGAIARRYDAAPWSGVNTALTFTLGVFVLRLGWGGQTPQDVVSMLLPAGIFLRFFTSKAAADPEEPGREQMALRSPSGDLVTMGPRPRAGE